ncbi:glutamyl-tRNA reductase [Pseudobacter ginsenosidimutans]|uniref:Glutamyl-tRNA reductase n=1 Tax=Pseudobacter ginsenosidimutans TaxID=661488 RepID=A0A4Q7MS82_9BACT|nr:glutamyl-tRNA reductase [Pseudobacter ginsenosidimutans]QEC41863.1 glutamyl-tRNA reductase [Pseudobacter ginsenosidimutans]RZS71318.1 glutamyl-tRNA reductase [Pseudobacter ginsenosidimutans]
MPGQSSKDISKFFIAGINYKKTDAAIRGKFAISNDQYASLLSLAPSYGLNELFILSTCNRTEIYGFADQPDQLIQLLCHQTEGNADTFSQLAYVKSGMSAIQHMFSVGAGLDSQILGDYEIVGQLKVAVKFAREKGFIGTFSERLVNSVLQSSKAIKNNTGLSGGTVSVSFAAIQFIKENIADIAGKEILLLGTGKIGRSTCKNIIDYLGTTNITLINRTQEKAAELAFELGVQYVPADLLSDHIRRADIIIVATNAATPTILTSHLQDQGNKLVIDLSIPCNVEESSRLLPNVQLVNVDELSRINDATLQKREAEVPLALAIIEEHIAEFTDWHEMRKHVPVLKAVKTKLKEIQTFPSYIQLCPGTVTTRPVDSDLKIQRVINGMASKMRQQNTRGCQYIEAINEFITTGSN